MYDRFGAFRNFSNNTPVYEQVLRNCRQSFLFSAFLSVTDGQSKFFF